MKNEDMHIVLGGSGAVGSAVIKELQKRKLPVKAVGRSVKVPGVETVTADLLNREQLSAAAAGATHIYLCIGLPYSSAVWKKDWPVVMKNTMDVCRENNAVLVFLDNVYMYGPSPLDVPFSEAHNQTPPSKKGRVRKEIADMLMSAVSSGEIKGLIGRSADFYGPGAKNSQFYTVFYENILKNKNPQWLGKPGVKHTYAYTEDNGRALVELALDESCLGEVWHLPVGEPVVIQDIMDLINQSLNSNYSISYMPRALMNLLRPVVPIVGEVKEMIYQFDNDYVMSWDKFREKFPDFRITPYKDGIDAMINSF